MNVKLENFKNHVQNKKVAILGLGISNTPLIRFLGSMDADITVFDKLEEEKLLPVMNEFKDIDIKYSLGADYLKNLTGFDFIFRSPGIRADIPELLSAKENGAQITSEMEVFFDLCEAEIFAVTGSDGKTTTTTLINKMLDAAGYKCWLGGNIGTPLLDKVGQISESDKVILELSSFQLQTMKKSPNVAVITNVTPNHLDIHKSMDEYIQAKTNIFNFQDENSQNYRNNKVILNYDNDVTRSFAQFVKSKAVYFSRVNSLQKGAVFENNILKYKTGTHEIDIVNSDEIVIPGVHNVENYLAAIAAVIDYVKPEVIRSVANMFRGVEHRIELVREVGGVKYYNDSIASSPARTIAGLNSFRQKVILIAGGYDKKIPYDIMGKYILDKVKCLVLIGQTGVKIEKAVMDEARKTGLTITLPIIKCDSLDGAIRSARYNAVSGDCIILSPASASFDMFKNFEDRGNQFKALVGQL